MKKIAWIISFIIPGAVFISFLSAASAEQTKMQVFSNQLSKEETEIIQNEAVTFTQILYYYATSALVKPPDLRLCAYEMLALKPNENSCRDKYSAWHSKEDYQESLLPEIEGKFGGVGLKVTNKEGRVIIISPIDGMPAEQAGVKSGDEIVEVDGKKINNVEDSVKLLRGKIGTKVRMKVRRGGANDLLTFELVRAEVIIRATESKTLRDGIGYIKIKIFSREMPGEFREIIKDFKNRGINKVIIDLRNNPGGLLNSALDLLYDFAKPSDVLMVMRGRNKNTIYNTDYVAPLLRSGGGQAIIFEGKKVSLIREPGTLRDMKIAIIINKGSASAPEIAAGAMKDWGFPVIGLRSFGKGVGQDLFPLADGSVLRLTAFEFLVGNSMTKINEIGVSPDYKISDPALLSAAEILREDRQLLKAIEILSQ